jgi:hypothetical protein
VTLFRCDSRGLLMKDLDYFTLLSTLLDVQTYYFMPATDFSPEILKRNVLKAYSTAQLLVRQAHKLHADSGFLYYAPHFVCRSLLAAACITLTVLLSNMMTDVPLHQKQTEMQEALSAIQKCSVSDGDLPFRASNMIERYWSINQLLPPMEVHIKEVRDFSQRIGVSFAFDCLRRWKRDLEKSRPNNLSQKKPLDGPSGQPVNLEPIQPDASQMIDWDAFMADFDWSFTPDYLNPSLQVSFRLEQDPVFCDRADGSIILGMTDRLSRGRPPKKKKILLMERVDVPQRGIMCVAWAYNGTDRRQKARRQGLHWRGGVCENGCHPAVGQAHRYLTAVRLARNSRLKSKMSQSSCQALATLATPRQAVRPNAE